MEAMVFNIPAQNMGELEKLLTKLNKKGKKAGTGEFKLTVVSETANKTEDGYVDVVKHVVVEGEAPKIDGWTFIARLDHNDDHTGNSNFIYTIPGNTLPEEFRNRPADCDHCGWIRKRRDTYIIRNDKTGALKQIGRTCVKDYIGLDPEKILGYAEQFKKLCDASHDAESQPLNRDGMWNNRLLNLEYYLAHVAMEIRKSGWVSRKEAYEKQHAACSTANRAIDTAFPGYQNPEVPTEDRDKETATNAISWALSLDPTKSDFNHNLVTIAKTGHIDFKATGLAAYIVQGYIKSKGLEKERIDQSNSSHVGEKGDKICKDVTILLKKALPMQDWEQFSKTLVRMIDTDGNVLVTFSTGQFPDGINVNDVITIRGTVVKHDEFNGIKQTIINRVREIN